jgi:uncharacterized membrane protein YphA (DoxX/SURF4 family)
MIVFKAFAQIIVGLGLINVWLLRFNKVTAFRGGSAKSMKEEFQVYGLPPAMLYIVGTAKVVSAFLLLIGLWFPILTAPAAAVVSVLMIGAIFMHIRVQDPLLKSLPAISVLVLSLCILFL